MEKTQNISLCLEVELKPIIKDNGLKDKCNYKYNDYEIINKELLQDD